MKQYAIIVRNKLELTYMNEYYGVNEKAYPRLYIMVGMTRNTNETILCSHDIEETKFFKSMGYKILNASFMC